LPKFVSPTPWPAALAYSFGAAAALIIAGPTRASQNLDPARMSSQMQVTGYNSARVSQAQPAEPSPIPEPQNVTPSAPHALPARNGESTRENEGTPATVVDAQQLESVLGKNVIGPAGESMGRIVDIIADHTGRVRAAIIDFGGFLGVGNRKIAVDWRMLHFPSDGKKGDAAVDLTRDQLRIAPVFTPGEPVVILGRTDAAP